MKNVKQALMSLKASSFLCFDELYDLLDARNYDKFCVVIDDDDDDDNGVFTVECTETGYTEEVSSILACYIANRDNDDVVAELITLCDVYSEEDVRHTLIELK